MKKTKKAPVKKAAAKKPGAKKAPVKKAVVKKDAKAKPAAKKAAPVKAVAKKVADNKVAAKKETVKPVAAKVADKKEVAKPVAAKVAPAKPEVKKEVVVKAEPKKAAPKKTLTKRVTTKPHAAPSMPLATNISSGGKKIFRMEFVIRSSPVILYDFVTATSNLAQWFADEVDRDREDIYTFTWDGDARKARVLEEIEHEVIKYQWMDAPDDEYLEFRITHTEITGDTVLIITDFAMPIDMKDAQFLWDSQVKTMIQQLGA
ncbi:MAG: START-like domain-containing protein [Bacteroidota bacterium]